MLDVMLMSVCTGKHSKCHSGEGEDKHAGRSGSCSVGLSGVLRWRWALLNDGGVGGSGVRRLLSSAAASSFLLGGRFGSRPN
ncbi:hypothetical protein Dimus_030610 [Dionaea muscipula]